jgi:phosphatidylserine decarboxylase
VTAGRPEGGAADGPAPSPAATALVQRWLPKQLLTQGAGWLAGLRGGALTTAAIRAFVGRYGVVMAEAANPDPAAYATFNAFFTRALREGARPLAAGDADLCPVDGAISQFGAIEGERLFQAKGHHYTATALLGGDTAAAKRYEGGHFATLYLSPKDYHRIHLPMAARLVRMVHVPGELYSVNPATARAVPGLFARNERVVCHFEESPPGRSGQPFVLVLVGATIVGSMATAWHGVVNPPRPGVIRHWDYAEGAVVLARGAEIGRFLLGSTVVLLWPRGPLAFAPHWKPGGPIRMGEAMAVRARTWPG